MKIVIRIAILLSLVSPALAAENTGAKVDPALLAQRKESVNTYLLNIYISQKRKPEAMAQYKVLLAMKPNDPKLNGDLGKFEASSGHFPLAISHLKKACDLDPANAEYWAALGATSLKAKKYQEALDAFKRAVELGGDKYRKTYDETLKYVNYMKQQEWKSKNNAGGSQTAPKPKQDDDEW